MGEKAGAELAAVHRLLLEGRDRLSVTGVLDVESFDESAAVLETSRGSMILRGQGFHVEELNLGAGEVRISGQVDSIQYEENNRTQGSFISRLFR